MNLNAIEIEAAPLKAILTPSVITVSPDVPLKTVLALMQQHSISSIVAVGDSAKPVGIFTEKDAIRLMLDDHSISSLCMADVMSQPVITVSSNLGYAKAYQTMSENNVRHLVVVGNEGQLLGLVSEGDFLHHMGMEYLVELKTVANSMSYRVKGVEPEASLASVLSLMSSEKISCTVIVEKGCPVGILTERDIVRLATENLDIEKVLAREVMATPLITVLPDLPLQIASRMMESNHVRRLVVVEHDGCLKGILTRHDIAKSLQGSYIEYLQETLERKSRALVNSEARLRDIEQRDFYQHLVEQVSDAIYIIDADDGRILDANEQASKSLAMSHGDLLNLRVVDLTTANESLNDWLEKNLSELKVKEELLQTTEYRRLDGTVFPVEVKSRLVRFGHKDYVVAIARDLTERFQAIDSIRDSEQRFRVLFEQSPVPMAYVGFDGKLISLNKAFTTTLGYSAKHLPDLDTWFSLAHPDLQYRKEARERWYGAIERARITDHKIPLSEYKITCLEGKQKLINASGITTECGFLAILEDVTERKSQEDRLRQAAAVFGSTTEGVMITSAAGVIQRVNKAFCRLTGYGSDEVIGQPAKILQSGRHDEQFYAVMWDSLREKGSWQGEIWNRRKDGAVYPELLSISQVTNDYQKVTHYVGVFSDISKLKESEQKLNYLAHHDMLTHLPNRLMLQSRLEQSLAVARRNSKQLALLLLDLDRFKDVNDSFGHAAGDELLQQVAVLLKDRLRQVDLVCRMGGDEFALLLEDIHHPEDAGLVANEVIEAISKRWVLKNGVDVAIGGSIGISIYPTQSEDAEALLQHADAALYKAKNEGRGCFNYFTEELTRDARSRLELEARLSRAIENQELEVFYQPQIDIVSGELIGAEALVRWQDPEKGLIGPADFIPLAEQTGLINPIGLFVLKQSCIQLKSWLDQGFKPITMAVNLSSVQLRHTDICQLVETVLEQTELPAQYLELEITESALMEREQEFIDLLHQLRKLGVKVAIDDFGTGYSSLAYLKKFPIDVLKIDKSFVEDIPQDKDDMVIAATIVAMGHSLGLKVLAEGVETQEQLRFLQNKACHYYQGYLSSRPVPYLQFEKLMLKPQ
ncbi:EAL domain-containing protein [Neptuniibacter sp. QD34_54]|uniref:EAL domain-containing protein n=1 Tax=unclassified Neptuniibacter TaxID=2630693 RepID=UPI0039F6CB7C